MLWLKTSRTGVSRHTGLRSQDIGDRSWMLGDVVSRSSSVVAADSQASMAGTFELGINGN